MGTEYRRGIPSVAHIEAATRLGLLWHRQGHHEDTVTVFCVAPDGVRSNYGSRTILEENSFLPLHRQERSMYYRSIRADGTLVDWSVLDAEAQYANMPAAQPQTGPQCEECEGSGRIYGATHDGSRTCGECSGRGYMLPPRAPAAQPRRHGGIEPRRFADVRPDRHGWRWWRIVHAPAQTHLEQSRFEVRTNEFRWLGSASSIDWTPWVLHYWPERTVIPTDEQGNPISWESIAQPMPTTASTQPLGFRADLWRRMCPGDSGLAPQFCLSNITRYDGQVFHFRDGRTSLILLHDTRPGYTDADILTRWAVYQELKPLYDLVDGAQGEAAMPADVEVAWYSASVNERRRAIGGWILARDVSGLLIKNNRNTVNWRKDEPNLGAPLRNFATVLDAVAERRVAERIRGQTPAPTVTPVPAQPEPRRFADVRPDRHGWRWWRMWGSGCIPTGSSVECQPSLGWRMKSNSMHSFEWNVPNSSDADRTVIPTDEQGNPVSWEAAGFAAEAVRGVQETVQRAAGDATPARSVGDIEWTVTGQTGTLRDVHTARIRQLDRFVAEAIQAGNTGGFSIESPTPPRPGQFSNNPAAPPLTPEGLLAAMQNYAVPGIHVTVGTGAKPVQTEAITTLPLPLPRFTADELDDVDHSQSTKLDSTPLKRGKLPTVGQIGKYREVMARRNGTAAEALKASGIDCEVAQYVLERWAGGLSDKEAQKLIADRYIENMNQYPRSYLDRVLSEVLVRSLDPAAEPTDDSVQRRREEREAQHLRMAALQAQLAAERAARTAEPQPEPNRFDLLECDPAADPAASIAAWEARQKRSAVLPMPKLRPTPRKPFDVVDAEAEGLRPGAVFTALLGRALNPNC